MNTRERSRGRGAKVTPPMGRIWRGGGGVRNKDNLLEVFYVGPPRGIGQYYIN